MESQHPSHPEVEQNLKNEEKEFNEKNILMYARIRIPKVLISEITTEEIYNSFYGLGKYKAIMQPLFSQQFEIARNGLKAAWFFDATS